MTDTPRGLSDEQVRWIRELYGRYYMSQNHAPEVQEVKRALGNLLDERARLLDDREAKVRRAAELEAALFEIESLWNEWAEANISALTRLAEDYGARGRAMLAMRKTK